MNETETFSLGDVEDVLTYDEAYPLLKLYLSIRASRDEEEPSPSGLRKPTFPRMEGGSGTE